MLIIKYRFLRRMSLYGQMMHFAFIPECDTKHKVKPMKDSLSKEGDHSSELKSPLLANDLMLILMFKSIRAMCSQICLNCILQNYNSVKGINLHTFPCLLQNPKTCCESFQNRIGML